MRFSFKLFLTAFLMTLLSSPVAAVAQDRLQPAAQGRRSGGMYERLYDASKVQKLSGEVLEIRKLSSMRDIVAMVVKTERGEEVVHLGPAWYVDHQSVRVAKGDRVEVVGSRVAFSGSPVTLAASVRKGSQVLQLRDGAGVPAWSGAQRAHSATR